VLYRVAAARDVLQPALSVCDDAVFGALTGALPAEVRPLLTACRQLLLAAHPHPHPPLSV